MNRLNQGIISLLLLVAMSVVAGCGGGGSSDGVMIAGGPGETTPRPPPASTDTTLSSSDEIGLGEESGTLDIAPRNGAERSIEVPVNGSADLGVTTTSRLSYRVGDRTFLYDVFVADDVETSVISFEFGPTFGFIGASDNALVTITPNGSFPAPIVEVVKTVPRSDIDLCSTGSECQVDVQINALFGEVKAPYTAHVIFREISPNVSAFRPVVPGVVGSGSTIPVTLFSDHAEQTQTPLGSKYELRAVVTTKALAVNDEVEAPRDLPGVVYVSEAIQINLEE